MTRIATIKTATKTFAARIPADYDETLITDDACVHDEAIEYLYDGPARTEPVSVTYTHTDGTVFTCTVDPDDSLEITRDGEWSGAGRWNSRIEDCTADWGEDTEDIYDALDSLVFDIIG